MGIILYAIFGFLSGIFLTLPFLSETPFNNFEYTTVFGLLTIVVLLLEIRNIIMKY